MLTQQQKIFALEYCRDSNGELAAIRSGYEKSCAAETACRLLKIPKIKIAIEDAKEKILKATVLDITTVLNEWIDIATADPSEIMQVRRVACPQCNPQNPNEWADPNLNCESCGGEGRRKIFYEDTRKLKGPAKRLYAGVQKTAGGIKVITRDQDRALENLSKYLGMFVERKEITGAGGGPLDIRHTARVEELTDDQLTRLIKNGTKDSDLSQ